MTLLRNVSYRSWKVWRRNVDVLLETWYLNLLPPLLEPVFYFLAFGFGIGQMVDRVSYRGQEFAYVAFMAPGVVAVAIMFWAFFETTYPTFVRLYFQKTFDALLATPLLVEDVIVGEILWGATKSVMASALMMGVLTAFGYASWPGTAWVLPISALGGVLFASVGIFATAISPKIDLFNLPIFLFIFPMFLFAGTFFPLDLLPGWAVAVANVLPLTHVAVLVRAACLGLPLDDFPLSWAYLLLVTPSLFVLALYAMKRRLTN